jgi:hypothetical protein
MGQTAAHKVAEALRAFEAAAATAAVDAITPVGGSRDLRPSVAVKFVGHLFDKALMNRILDLVVDSTCEFKGCQSIWVAVGPSVYVRLCVVVVETRA